MHIEYKMIGGDGREYGPASLDEIKSWIREGRISGSTMIWRSDSSAWVQASHFIEFQAELGGGKVASLSASQDEAVGFFPRFASYLIDQVVLSIILYAIWQVFFSQRLGWEMPNIDPSRLSSPEEIGAAIQAFVKFGNRMLVILLPTSFLYEVILNGTFGATLGKKIIRARIVFVDGSAIDYKTAAFRWGGERLSDMFLCCIGHFFVLVRSDKRAMHDLIVGTRVIYKR